MSETVIRIEQDPCMIEQLKEINGKLDLLVIPKVYTVEEVSDILQVGYSTARDLVVSGKIRAHNVGTGKNCHYRITSEQLRGYLLEGAMT
jgi:excisionase family DNA binding protein